MVKEYYGYKVTSEGIVFNKDGSIKQPFIAGKGYLYIKLYINGKSKSKAVHRIIAETFIDNQEKKNQVNHIDGNKKNNNVENLEWVSCRENVDHAMRTGLMNGQNVIAYKDGNFIGVWPSIRLAAKNFNVNESSIRKALNGKIKSVKGCCFSYNNA